MTGRRRKHWGWGHEDEQPSADVLATLAPTIAAHLDPAAILNPGVLVDPVAAVSPR